ncbi:ROK family protein [Catellatospora sichuanensis]|uniref:ROK family protein n=1 Tax=Catellatospora sichuanensis TaxID=1969805 RepID=UPI001181FD20|nr:ROK family protein [Catellatospora sichuanensis]
MKVYAIDIGGSSVKHALVEVVQNHGARIIDSYDTVQLRSNAFEDLKEQILKTVYQTLALNKSLDVVAISTTGSVSHDGTVINAGHFAGYSNVSWGNILKAEFRQIKRVATCNDGRASAWAEYIAQGKSAQVFAHFVVGTGVGGGIVHGGQLLIGDHSAAGTFGHIKVDLQSDLVCSCTRIGCVEMVAAAPAVARYYSRSLRTHEALTLDDVTAAVTQGDDHAEASFIAAGSWLGVAIGDVMNILNPGIITLGGGVILASESIHKANDGGPYVRAAIERARANSIRRISAQTIVRPAVHGNDGGMLGAALLAC